MRNGLIGIGMIVMIVELGTAGCSAKACTDIGCSDGFTATIQRADGSFPNGAHRIELLADGTTLMCSFTFPPAGQPPGSGFAPTCPTGLFVFIAQQTNGGPFVEMITVAGRPAQVHAWQYVDDATVLDAAAAPSYTESRPNGPDCSPVCRQASASWTMQ